MTATANETALDVAVDVRFTPAGNPLAVRYNGRIWAVMADPVHWFTTDLLVGHQEIRAGGHRERGGHRTFEGAGWPYLPSGGVHSHVCFELGSSRNARIIYP